MTPISIKAMNAITTLATAVFAAHVSDGGRVLNGDRDIPPEVVASSRGCMPALIWLFSEFADDMGLTPEYGIPMEVDYQPDSSAYAGFSLGGFKIAQSVEAMTLLGLTDFFRNELVPANVVDFDMAPLLRNFEEWCHNNVPANEQAFAMAQPE